MRNVEYNGAILLINFVKHGYAHHKYEVTLVSGAWPNDNDLITLCDGDDPKHKHPLHFGGKVNRFGDKADVTVYID